MRDTIAQALRDAQKSQDRIRVATLRLITAAIQDRDIANRGVGKERVSDDEILQILTKMVKQREESAKAFADGGRPELAAAERAEIEIVKEFLPRQIGEDELRRICADVIAETGAASLRDMGAVMAVLKERYPGRIDFSRASAIVKELLA
ncbi:GatB/YqeY domain-containing protein [Neoaquamicrobium sediminum]|uniref:GatB/YqeY domain-containing protein n=1 Tax=Neoaquamicrobium sediminum TaxID=1849104 RepID=UPI0015637420|nr:GatB/YqeY domain-containing protein [Mesorhizobium sediminum]MBX9450770.1 GatB/YqeY domain-containing protein [Mesorhizobium sp.]NRC55706.1 GatB/YqeY domain-containing protein [Mesorhizobium sediminum]